MITACVYLGCAGLVMAFVTLATSGENRFERGFAVGLCVGSIAVLLLALGAVWVGTWAR